MKSRIPFDTHLYFLIAIFVFKIIRLRSVYLCEFMILCEFFVILRLISCFNGFDKSICRITETFRSRPFFNKFCSTILCFAYEATLNRSRCSVSLNGDRVCGKEYEEQEATVTYENHLRTQHLRSNLCNLNFS